MELLAGGWCRGINSLDFWPGSGEGTFRHRQKQRARHHSQVFAFGRLQIFHIREGSGQGTKTRY